MKLLFTILFLFTTVAVATDVRGETNTVSTVTGTTTVDKAPSSANAPSVVINNQDVCSTADSVAVQHQVLGVAIGKSTTDLTCERIKLARSLYGMGMKIASVSLLCQDKRVFTAMWHSSTFCPYEGLIGLEAKQGWIDNPTKRPDYKDLILEKPKKEKSNDTVSFKTALGMAISVLILF